MYKIAINSSVLLKPFGEFDSALFIPIPEMWERRSDMQGHHFRYKILESVIHCNPIR